MLIMFMTMEGVWVIKLVIIIPEEMYRNLLHFRLVPTMVFAIIPYIRITAMKGMTRRVICSIEVSRPSISHR